MKHILAKNLSRTFAINKYKLKPEKTKGQAIRPYAKLLRQKQVTLRTKSPTFKRNQTQKN